MEHIIEQTDVEKEEVNEDCDIHSLINGSADVQNGQIDSDKNLELELPNLQSIVNPSLYTDNDHDLDNDINEETLNTDESLLELSSIKQEEIQAVSKEQNEIYVRKYESSKVSKI